MLFPCFWKVFAHPLECQSLRLFLLETDHLHKSSMRAWMTDRSLLTLSSLPLGHTLHKENCAYCIQDDALSYTFSTGTCNVLLSKVLFEWTFTLQIGFSKLLYVLKYTFEFRECTFSLLLELKEYPFVWFCIEWIWNTWHF